MNEPCSACGQLPNRAERGGVHVYEHCHRRVERAQPSAASRAWNRWMRETRPGGRIYEAALMRMEA
jgi:hypothetical protein